MPFSIDIRTVIFLIFFGNLVTVAILAAYQRDEGVERFYRFFFTGKLVETLGWALLLFRGSIPDLISIYLGNTLLFIGFALESAAMATIDREQRLLEKAFLYGAAIGSVVFWIFGNSPSQRIVIASLVVAVFFGTVSVAMLRAARPSRLHRVIAGLFSLLCVALIVRALGALLSASEMNLFTPNLVQDLSFLMLFLFMLVGGVGFLLLLKEKIDHQLFITHQELSSREVLIKKILDTSSVGIFLVDTNGRITLTNQWMADMFGSITSDRLLGTHYLDYVAPADRDMAEQRMNALLDGSIPLLKIERQYYLENGSSFWGQLTSTRMYDEQSGSYKLVGVIADITERKQIEERMRQVALHDALTGLANRILFSDRLQQSLVLAQRDQIHFALLYLDLDGFKPVNDNFGHATGDLLLQEVAQRMIHCVRESDTVARLGGDEFAVLLHGIGEESAVLQVAEKLHQSLNQVFPIADQQIAISCSIGIAIYPEHGRDEASLSKHADAAMYQAKRDRLNKIRLAT